jgi:hypothetical protein
VSSQEGNEENTRDCVSTDAIKGEVERVYDFVETMCRARADMFFGYDWKGSSTGDERDHHHSIRRFISTGTGTMACGKIDFSDKDAIADSYLFKGYCGSVRAGIKTLCQMPHVAQVVVICIKGGTFTQLEEEKLRGLVKDTRKDHRKKMLEPNVEVRTMEITEFKEHFQQPLWRALLRPWCGPLRSGDNGVLHTEVVTTASPMVDNPAWREGHVTEGPQNPRSPQKLPSSQVI